jgi:uncharacterized membrane protein YraQ (UPF0718 family)
MRQTPLAEIKPGPDEIVKSENKAALGSLLFKLIIAAAVWVIIYRFLAPVTAWITHGLLGLSDSSHLGSAIEFFIFEAPKVLMLLVAVVFIVGIIRSFFTPERTRQMLAGRREFIGNIMASGLGIVTPFCSCSAIPLFIGFVETGVPLGVTLSFLVAAPMINEVAVVLLLGMFGIRIAAIYVSTGLVIAILSGLVIGKLHLERYIEDWVHTIKLGENQLEEVKRNWHNRVGTGWIAVKEIVGKVWPFVLGGIAVGAFIHGYVPQNLMASIMTRGSWWAVPLAVVLGVPMYSNAAGIFPIMQALLEKGVPLGTALAFMMAVIGLSLPETVILRKVLKIQLIMVFIGIVALGIMMVGFLFNFIL